MAALRIAVVIPALNEAGLVRASIESAAAAGADRIIVSDGGSSDDTIVIARSAGAQVITGPPPRGQQLNRGASVARCDVLCFLHADSTLPPTACDAIREALDGGRSHGGFTIRFSEPHARLRFVAAMINIRSCTTGLIWGDQAQFFRTALFESLEGYRPIPIMEDYDLIRRARVAGRPALIRDPVTTSGRRFLGRGVVRTTATNWKTIAMYHAGVSPERLAESYRRR